MDILEIEIKFRVNDLSALERQLRQRFGNVEFGEQATEFDVFFQHPCRDFKQTDECLRLRNRQFTDGTSEHSLTYKGQKIDTSTKTRHEIEMPITEPERWKTLLTALGFHQSASVQKIRRRIKLTVNHRHVEIVLDTLPALPESGRLFLEIETLAPVEELEACRTLILDIAEQLELGEPVRDSYLKLVQDCIEKSA